MAKKTAVLVVLDGWGIGKDNDTNPLFVAKPPTFEWLAENYPVTSLQASGIAVGLPWGEVGNSEVGHLTLGAGKVIYQYYPKITMAIRDGTFFENPVLKAAFAHARDNNSAINFAGLLTKANVHASLEHLQALLKMAQAENVTKINLHLFGDGEDSPPHTIEKFLGEVPKEYLASLVGRYYAMDRNNNWRLTQTAYEVMTGTAGQIVDDPLPTIEATYKQSSSEEYLPALRFAEDKKLQDGDALVFFNDREDSIRQLASAFITKGFDHFPLVPFNNLYVATFTHYDDKFDVSVAFPADNVVNPIGKVLSDAGLAQLRLAETYKYAHVTYFFNGLREPPFKGEFRTLVPSNTAPHPEEHPEMMASAITDRLIDAIGSHGFDFILVNYANPDTIAHTANFKISVAAELASMSAQQLPLNLDNALVLAAKALQTRDTLEARGSLINAFAEAPAVCWINRGHGGVTERAMFLPDGRGIVIVNGDNSVSTLDIRTHREAVEPLLQQEIQRNSTIASPASTTAIALSPNGKLLAVGTRDNSIIIWNLQLHRAEGHRLEGHKNWVQELNFDPSGTLLISASDEQVVLWNLAAGSRIDVRPPNQITSQVAFSNDGKEFLVGGHAPTRFGTTNRPMPPVPEENAISVFSVPNAELKSPPLTECGVSHGQIQIRPGTEEAGCLDDDGRLRLLDWKSRTSALMPGGEAPKTSSFAFTPDGQEVAYYDEDFHEIRTRSLSGGQTVQYRLYRAFHRTSRITVSPDGRFIAFVGDNVLYLLDRKQVSPIATVLADAPGRVLDLAATPDGRFIALGLDRARIEVRRLASAHSNVIPLPRTSPDKQVNTVAVSKDGKWLAAGDSGGTVYVWTMGDEIRRSCEVEAGSEVRSLAFSPGQNHDLVAGLDSGEILLIDRSCHPGPRVRAHTRNVMAMAFSPSGQLTSSGADDDIQFWLEFGKPEGAVVKANQQYVRRLVFSSTGKMFSAGQDGSVGFWSNKGAMIRHLAHELQASSLTLSPGGDVLVSGSLDRSLGIWDVDRERIVGRTILTIDPVMGAAFIGPDKVVSGHLSGKVLKWELSPAAWAETARRTAGRGEQ